MQGPIFRIGTLEKAASNGSTTATFPEMTLATNQVRESSVAASATRTVNAITLVTTMESVT